MRSEEIFWHLGQHPHLNTTGGYAYLNCHSSVIACHCEVTWTHEAVFHLDICAEDKTEKTKITSSNFLSDIHDFLPIYLWIVSTTLHKLFVIFIQTKKWLIQQLRTHFTAHKSSHLTWKWIHLDEKLMLSFKLKWTVCGLFYLF